ncbi:hypothetical protein AZF37_03080 [endosymbiont 'TC1' of Trimyema compressum]|uniref:hypothetical protein n=1 Tax=endosymbiont 'TC1' of Trimyema compressum TaxID=243899 RepID=UPI0007F0AC3B|nr:hypothetical protein [endosymbiont 'TC1' of Trimyema compressum]AMP20285.1 hypothetical protein AZF37_03080 [endosymbiont 'TC1' of Trimyema compressum]
MGTRTLNNENEKSLTIIMLMPFFSCGAKLPIWSIFAMAFFPAHADLTIFAIYFLGIFVAIITAIILKNPIQRTYYTYTFYYGIASLPLTEIKKYTSSIMG